MAENQEQVKPKEREIPVFTVLKNNCILKNIFVLDNPPPISSSSSALGAEISGQESEREEILLVGRHPDCNIKLEHPSISRFHLRIHSKPSSRSLLVTDLSSVHGTCISGKRIEPGVMMELAPGDALKLGESSRLYRLDWVPISFAYEVNDPFVPHLDSLDTVNEETEGATDQDDNCLSRENDWSRDLSDEIEALGWQFCEEDLGLSMQETTAEVENICLPELFNKENEFSTGSQLLSMDASVTVDEGTEGVMMDQDGDSLLHRNYQGQDLGDMMENLERASCNKDLALSIEKMSSAMRPQPEDESEIVRSPEIYKDENEFYGSQLCLGDIMENLERPSCNKDLALSIEKMSSAMPPLPEDEAEIVRSPEIYKDENEFYGSQLCLGDIMENLERPSSNKDLALSIEKMSSAMPPQPEDEAEIVRSPEIYKDENKFYGSQLCLVKENTPQPEDEVESISSPEICINENDFSSSQLCQIEKESMIPCQIEKESTTPQVRIPLAETTEAFEMNMEKRLGMNIWSRRGKSEGVKIKTSRSKGTCTRIHMSVQVKSLVENSVNKSMLKDQCVASHDKDPDKENVSPDSCLVRSLGSKFDEALKSESISIVDEDEEAFTSDKENMTPNTHLLRSIKNGSSEEVRLSNLHKPSTLKTASRSILQEVCQQHKVLQERKSESSASKSHCSLKKQPYVVKAARQEPLLPLPVISTGAAPIPSVHECTVKESRSVEYSKVSGNRWIIVVDTACLLNKKSRSELQLLRGLRGTSLVIPRIVLRELDCMVRRASFLSRMTDASAALQWIEECMASITWWIHVQSSAEESRLVPPTPPAASAHWFGEDKGSFSVSSIPFSPYTLQEIVSPTAADHILESALFFKQNMKGQLVLLSDDVTLKIKAMAEGVICETAQEFRASLVNPFSTRFLYSDSSPRGPTWTCVDDTVLKEKYYPSPTKKATRSGDGAKGLKLILLHNSNFRQMRASAV